MSNYINRLQSNLVRTIVHMDTWQWTVFLLVVVLVGAFCMRGYGPRKNY